MFEQNNNNLQNKDGSKAENLLSDSTITMAVKAKLLIEPNVKSLEISVETINGEVILRGDVTDFQNRSDAEAVARSVDGVKSVRFEHKA